MPLKRETSVEAARKKDDAFIVNGDADVYTFKAAPGTRQIWMEKIDEALASLQQQQR